VFVIAFGGLGYVLFSQLQSDATGTVVVSQVTAAKLQPIIIADPNTVINFPTITATSSGLQEYYFVNSNNFIVTADAALQHVGVTVSSGITQYLTDVRIIQLSDGALVVKANGRNAPALRGALLQAEPELADQLVNLYPGAASGVGLYVDAQIGGFDGRVLTGNPPTIAYAITDDNALLIAADPAALNTFLQLQASD
jgi:hypothetical protein